MFELTCECGKKHYRMSIKDTLVLICDCKRKLIEDWQPTCNVKITQKVLFPKHSLSSHRDEFRKQMQEKYGNQNKRLNELMKNE